MGLRVLEYRVWGSGFQGVGVKGIGFGLRVELRVQGPGSEVQGSGVRA